MGFIADLHIHSRYSRATSQDLGFPALHRAALKKGVQVVGTGDFTHPAWMREIEEQLEPAEEGLFRLKEGLARKAEEGLPRACAGGRVRFVLTVEVSNIYKRAGRVRKNHNLVLVPTLEAARRFVEKLSAVGNLTSDGRPILGLDARDLLEITLETDPLAFLIPAHIWTPWFSMLGSMSGFDSIEECFGDLAGHVFAAETGLSSDPPMNWRVSALDRIALVSNSDAHSPPKLGREANLFEVELGYAPIRRALETRQGFLGTLEFFPEEGKYHLDGHRKCRVRLTPEETRALEGRCPVCGGKLTVGVMSRVLDLADRPAGAKPERIQPYQSLVSLGQTVGEALGAGPDSRRAQGVVAQLLNRIGPELVVLRDAPLDDLSRCAGAAVAEAVRRVRAGELSVEAGYDGEYGTIQIFTPEDRADLAGQISLLGSPTADRRPPARIAPPAPDRRRRPEAVLAEPEPLPLLSPTDPLGNLDPDQLRAARTRDGPLLIVAGPGTGKTRTLVARIAHQVKSGSVAPRRVLAISFTNQACEELQARLREALAPEVAEQILVATFHGFGRWLLREHGHRALEVIEDEARVALVREIAGPDARRGEAADLLRCVSLAKQSPDPEGALRATERELEVFRRYQAVLAESGLLDVDDLVLEAFRLLRDQGAIARAVAERFHSVSVDEYQDVNDVQAALVALLCPGGRTLCAIGDPDQAIYGFRGARPGHFLRFASTFPGARALSLTTTYRLTRQILEVARSVAGAAPVRRDPFHALCDGPRVEVVACHAPREEAEWIAARLRHAVGATDMVDADAGLDRGDHLADVGFGEVAVLVRTKAQRGEILEALGRAGIPARSVGEDEPHDPRSQKVAVMTLHAAKGREFPAVFVAGVESGLVPLEIEGLVADPEEERRLLYVAITRAKRLAVLSHCERRTLFGRPLPGGPSPFLRSLPAEMVKLCAAPSPTPKRGAEQLNLL